MREYWKISLENSASNTRKVMKERFLILVLSVLVLCACSTVEKRETRPLVDASAYLFDLDVSIDPQLQAQFDPKVAKGKGDAVGVGFGSGFAGCFTQSAVSGDLAAPFMIPIVFLVSLVCGVAEGAYEGITADSEEEVIARLKAFNDTIEKLDYPSSLVRLVSNDLISRSPHHILGASADLLRTNDTEAVIASGIDNEVPTPKIDVREEDYSTRSLPVVTGNAEDTEKSELEENIESKQNLPKPTASLSINITNFSLSGAGADPKFKLQMSAAVCIQEYATGDVLLYKSLTVNKSGKKLKEWAALGETEFEAKTRTLVRRLNNAIFEIMASKEVEGSSKKSCES